MFRSLAFLILAVPALAAPKPLPPVRAVEAFRKLHFKQPVELVSLADRASNGEIFYLAERPGRILTFARREEEDGVSPGGLFLDLRPKVRTENAEEGLLSLAFHPGFARNHRFYVLYSLAGASPRQTVLSEFTTRKDDPRRGDEASEKVLFRVTKPFGNHNGGTLLFGPDGMLYFGLGDGGGAGDPQGNAQNLASPLGKIMRLDVDKASSGRPYGVPADNPFVRRSGAMGEIWAYGLRNPWRMSFDPATGQLWCADVGQDRWEEVDRIARGGNYGWNLREGRHPYKTRGTGKTPAGLVDPLVEYGHDQGICVIGGCVYHGREIPGLDGHYIFGDFGSRRLWAVPANAKPGRQAPLMQEIGEAPEAFSSFAQDQAGEIYLLGTSGTLYRLVGR